ncbi:hypothetical protein Bca4012_015036 [Brassica carinata]
MSLCSSFIFLVLFSLLASFRVYAQNPGYLYHYCPNTTTYTRNSTYFTNLKTLLSSLSSSPGAYYSTGFRNSTVGRDPDTVRGLFLCRGDLSPEVCSRCVAFSVNETLTRCPNESEVVLYYSECMLRYSNRNILSTVIYDGGYIRLNGNVSSNQEDRFEDLVSTTMNQAADKAANSSRKFYTIKANWTALETLYGLVQCTPDLTRYDCLRCLHQSIDGMPLNKIGGTLIWPSCNARYELYSFFNESGTGTPPEQQAPPPKRLLPPPPASTSPVSSLTRTGELFYLPLFLLCFLKMFNTIHSCSKERKKKFKTIHSNTLSGIQKKRSSFLPDTIFERTDLRVVFDAGARRRRLFSPSSLLCSNDTISSLCSVSLPVLRSGFVRTRTAAKMTANALTADAGLIITSIGCFSGESWKVLSPGPLSLCSIKFGFTSISIYSHLCFEDLFQRLHTFQPQDHLTASASIDKAFFVRGIPPSTCRPDPGFRSLCHVCRNIYPDKSYFAIIVHVFPPLGLAGRPAYSGEGSFSLTSVSYPSTGSLSSISDHHLCVTSRFTWSDVVQQSSSNNWLRPNKMLILVNPLSSFSKPSTASTLPPFPLPMERDDSSALLRRLFSYSSVCYLAERSLRGQKMQSRIPRGYMAPEYAIHGQFSMKSDVYSFGVLVLEIISGKKNNSFNEIDSAHDLVTYAWRLWSNGTALHLVDPIIIDNFQNSEVVRCIHIGLLCVQEDPVERPTFSTIFVMLTSQTVTLPVPRQPGSFVQSRPGRDPLDSDQSTTTKSDRTSVDDASITDIYSR